MRRPEPQAAEVSGEPGEACTGTTDAEIIRLSGREPERFAAIFDRYYAEVYGYVERRLGPSLADDVAAGLVAAGSLAAAGVAVLLTSDPHPPLPGGQVGSAALAANVLDRASAAAEHRHFTPPRSHQWIYTKMSRTTGAGPGGVVTGGPYTTEVEENWVRADGRQSAGITNGKLSVGPVSPRPQREFSSDPLPTDPDELLRKVGVRTGGYAMAYESLVDILALTVQPPKEEAAIFQAIKRIPHVTLIKGRADAAGRPAIALGLEKGAIHEEVLLSPETYAFLGDRVIQIKDQTLDAKTVVKKGTLQYERLRTAVGIVAKPGRRPS